MRGMGRVGGEHLLAQGIECQRTGDGNAAIAVDPGEAYEKRPGFKIIGILKGQSFQGGEKRLASGFLLVFSLGFFLWGLVFGGRLFTVGRLLGGSVGDAKKLLGSCDPRLLTWGRLIEPGPGGCGEKLLGTRLVFEVGHCQAPVRHHALGIELQHGAKTPFRLPVPKAVQLPDALVEVLLGFFRRGGDREVHLPAARDQR